MTEPASTAASCSESSLLPPEIAIGIDIGTTPFRVSVWNDSELEVWLDKMNEIMRKCCETSKDHDFSIGASSSRSTEVSLENENMNKFFNIIFGEKANFPFLMHTVDIEVRPFVAAFMKKLWKSTTSVEILGKFLMELRSIVETRCKRPIRKVVFTVPVSFSRLQVNRIHHACEMADLKVIKLMPQPIAVALWYVCCPLYSSTSSHEVMDNESKKIALIFNMDAGYCDVSVIEAERGKLRIKALTGSTIGGEDLLGNMMCHLLLDSEKIFKTDVHCNSDILSMAFLRSRIHDLITKLSTETSVEVDLESIDGLKIQRVVRREEFEDVNKDVFQKCKNLIIECLEDAKIEAENINHVIIVGRCCYIPRVKNLVTEICNGKEIYKGIDPLIAVLFGAAVAGADNESFTSQVTLHAIGIRADEKKFVPVIPKNTSMPTMWDKAFSTVNGNQTTASIVVCEGVKGQKAEENNVLGNFEITEIPEAAKGVPEITVSMSIDRKNILTVTAFVGLPGFTPVVTKFDDQLLIRTYDDTIRFG